LTAVSVGNGSASGELAGKDGAEGSAPGSGLAVQAVSLAVDLPSKEGKRSVLRDVTFSVEPGEFVGIVGPSGSGKTTLLRALGGLVRPSAGKVVIGGLEVSAPPDGTGIVFQNYSSVLLPWRTVGRNVSLGLEGKVPRPEIAAVVDEVLTMVGLLDYKDEYPWRLSGGMQQRVQIARALSLKPQLLLMDEPFGSLDAMTREELQDSLQTIYSNLGSTIIFVTHDIDEVVYLCDRVLVLDGTPASVADMIPVPLPRPRDQIYTKADATYQDVRRAVRIAIHSGPARTGG
jgi:NitT/TauT family transport system ATP-binding protein